MKNDGEKSLNGRERVKSGRSLSIFMMRAHIRNFFFFLLLEEMRAYMITKRKSQKSLIYLY